MNEISIRFQVSEGNSHHKEIEFKSCFYPSTNYDIEGILILSPTDRYQCFFYQNVELQS